MIHAKTLENWIAQICQLTGRIENVIFWCTWSQIIRLSSRNPQKLQSDEISICFFTACVRPFLTPSTISRNLAFILILYLVTLLCVGPLILIIFQKYWKFFDFLPEYSAIGRWNDQFKIFSFPELSEMWCILAIAKWGVQSYRCA